MLLKCITTLVLFSTIKTSYSEIYCANEEVLQIGQNSKCNRGLHRQPVSCLEPILANTTVLIDCKYNYKVSKESKGGSRQIRCEPNGEWSQNAYKCEEKCAGTIFSPLSIEQIWDNRFQEVTKSPWIIGIYKVNNNNEDFAFTLPLCGGVLLNAKLVLAHAGCLKKYDMKDLTVMAGKFDGRTSWPDPFYQFSKIKNVYVNDNHPIRRGPFGDTRLAIIELENYFSYTRLIRPACINWDLLSEKSQSLNEVGLLPTWGDVEDCVVNRYRKHINTLEIRNFMDYSKCSERSTSSQAATQYPIDTFCFKYDSKSEIEDADCYGLSGSGMFLKGENETEANKNSLWAIAHYREKLNLGASRIRYVKSFIKLLPQKDFILHYLEEFKYNKLLSEDYLRKPCIMDFRENVHRTSEVTCYLNDELILCQQETKPGTIVRSKCKFGYARSTDDGPNEKTCLRGGRWSNELVDCTKICGQITPSGSVGLVFNGKIAEIENVPWHVGIYINNTSINKFVQICGGTIVHSNIVITAAHCFWDASYNRPNDKNLYAVAAGKHFRNFRAAERQRVQYSKIKELTIPRTYNVLYYRHDIAVLVLETPFQFSGYTKPACLTLLQFGNYDLGGDVKGIVSGWGATSQTIESSDVLQAIEISTMTNEDCTELVDWNSKDEITGEKFCARGKEGQTACAGDSGGGFLVPQIEEDGIRRFYLWGVVSSGLNPTQHCTANFFSTYTNVQYHQDIINVVISNNTLL